ncbi:MAG: YraN family protein [Alphaproteobacteria bacterium]|nr:YraN family protein [Alphaproteobacteria bacterium]
MGKFRGRTKQQRRAHQFGVQAEKLAALYLRAKGYRILSTRYRVGVGEIDIVARSGDTIVFIEVKRRQNLAEALHSLQPRQQARIIRAAEHWLAENELPLNTDCRFDMMVFSAYLVPHHIKNAFATDGT